MKKGLSVLLIVAALFGFYGGATSLNDILASKDYWEEVGEKSTADMNKLEDGLNQLKDNEAKYLDGKQQVADGEIALADAEKQLADGEAKLAAGKAELAKGYADYAAAPAKLAAGKEELAEGKEKLDAAEDQLAEGKEQLDDAEEQLAEGKKSLKGLKQLIKGCDTVINGYSQWKDGYDQLNGAAGRKKLVAAAKSMQSELMLMAKLAGGNADSYTKGLQGVLADDGSEPLDTFAGYTEQMFGAMGTINANASTLAGALNSLIALSNVSDAAGAAQFWGAIATDAQGAKTGLTAINDLVKTLTGKAPFTDAINNAPKLYEAAKAGDPTGDAVKNAKTVHAGLEQIKSQYGDTIAKAIANTQSGGTLYDGLDGINSNYADLAAAQDKLAGGIQQIAYNVLNNKTLKDAVVEKMGSAVVAVLTLYSSEKTSPLFKANGETCEKFIGHMETNPGLVGFLTKAKALLQEALSQGTKTYKEGLAKYKQGKATYDAGLAEYNKGKATYDAGLKEYKQGLADYAAAPAKLADGEKQVADGEKQLADGYKQYEDGKKTLADGKAQLAQYEDGEQQVRDGLATLMATEADPGLESILERRNGDDKFDDENGHLDLNEGLEAVDVGRGYQADSGDLITKEITSRAIGTAAGLAAAALAIVAAILSFLKKNKGAAVFGVLTAVAGGVAAGVGFSAGEYYSDIAGSTVGNTPFIAGAALTVVAAVFAIVHFASKPEAK